MCAQRVPRLRAVGAVPAAHRPSLPSPPSPVPHSFLPSLLSFFLLLFLLGCRHTSSLFEKGAAALAKWLSSTNGATSLKHLDLRYGGGPRGQTESAAGDVWGGWVLQRAESGAHPSTSMAAAVVYLHPHFLAPPSLLPPLLPPALLACQLHESGREGHVHLGQELWAQQLARKPQPRVRARDGGRARGGLPTDRTRRPRNPHPHLSGATSLALRARLPWPSGSTHTSGSRASISRARAPHGRPRCRV